MHFYSIGYWELLKLPISVFWAMSKTMNRIKAEDDKRMFMVVGNSFGGDAEKLLRQLDNEAGEIITTEGNGFDRKGFNVLKAKFAGRR